MNIQEQPLTFDPFKMCVADVHDSILQHMNGNDLKNATEVSASFNLVIGQSTTAMKKLLLNLSSDVVTAVLQSQRNYSNVDVKMFSSNAVAREEILAKLSPSVVNLNLKNVPTNLLAENSKFQKLESLSFGPFVNSGAVHSILTALENFHLNNLCLSENVINDNTKPLNNQTRLKKITMSLNFLKNANYCKVSDFAGLQLKTLVLRQDFEMTSKDTIDNEVIIVQLLKIQSSTLEIFVCDYVTPNIWLQILNLPKLKFVEVPEVPNQEYSNQSKSIITAKVWKFDYELKPILQTLPRLKNLKVPFLRSHQMLLIARTLLNLEKLYIWSQFTNAVRAYDNLKTSDEPNLNRTIELVEKNTAKQIFE